VHHIYRLYTIYTIISRRKIEDFYYGM